MQWVKGGKPIPPPAAETESRGEGVVVPVVDIPYEDLSEIARLLLVNVLLGAAELDVHVAVDGDEAALVLGLAPL